MIDKTIIICGLCRNIEPYFKDVFQNINFIKQQFKKAYCLFIENDSKDSTASLLKNRIDEDTISFKNLDLKYPSRTQRIAYCRNKIFQEVLSNSKYQDVDYILWMDMDDICTTPITKESIESNNFNDSEWAMKCAYKQTGYYDIWALRHAEYSPDDCIHNLIKDGWHNQWAHEKHVHSRMKKIDELKNIVDLLEVDSAFGGMAFVNKKYLSENIKFIGISDNNMEKCEWVSFCDGIRNNNGKIYINYNFKI